MADPATLLLTRPEPASAAMARDLRAKYPNLRCIISPLFKIIPCDEVIELDGISALVFTSANGLETFASASPRRDLPAYCVGEKTAAAARALGMAVLATAATSEELSALLTASPSGPLLHLHGRHVAGGFAPGIMARSQVIYEQPPLPLAAEAETALAAGAVDAVVLYSPRSARLFGAILNRFPPEPLTALCISEAAADALAGRANVALRVAEQPTGAAMDTLIAKFLNEIRQ